MRCMRCGLDVRVARFRAAIADVLARTGGEDNRILWNQADAGPQRMRIGLANVDAVEPYSAELRVVET